MKFYLLLVAGAAAVSIENPSAAYKGFEDGIKEARKVVAAQEKFEADHFKKHTAAMEKAHNEAHALKTKIR